MGLYRETGLYHGFSFHTQDASSLVPARALLFDKK